MTTTEKDRIIELYMAGWSVRRIAAHTGYSPSSVHRITEGVAKDELVSSSSASHDVRTTMRHSTPPSGSSSVSLGEIAVAVVSVLILGFVFYPLLSFRSH